MIFSESRFPLFRIMLWDSTRQRAILRTLKDDRLPKTFGGRRAEISSGELQDLSVGAARGDCAAREEHPVRISAHRVRQPARLVSCHFAAQESAGAAHRRKGVAVRIERDCG